LRQVGVVDAAGVERRGRRSPELEEPAGAVLVPQIVDEESGCARYS
jgi:hypothetical protein